MATIREKENDLRKVEACVRNYHRAAQEMEKAGIEYVNKYSPYKKGQKILFESVAKENFGVIQKIGYDRNSQLEAFCVIYVKPYRQDFSCPIHTRANVIIKDKELFKTIKIID